MKKGLRHPSTANQCGRRGMKALPDEEGIETHVCFKKSNRSCMKALPDEEGIETNGKAVTGRPLRRYEGTP